MVLLHIKFTLERKGSDKFRTTLSCGTRLSCGSMRVRNLEPGVPLSVIPILYKIGMSLDVCYVLGERVVHVHLGIIRGSSKGPLFISL